MSERNIVDVEVVGVGGQEIGDRKFLDEPGQDPRDASLPVEHPFVGDASQFGEKILIALNWSGDHRWKKKNESHVLADSSSFGFAAVAVPGVMKEFECKKRNAQRQKCILPIERIVRRVMPDKPRKKIAVFEDGKKKNCLHDAQNANPGIRFVKPADKGLPKKNKQASSADCASELRIGKVGEEEATAAENNPGAKRRAYQAKQNGRGNQEEKIVVPSVENHFSTRKLPMMSASIPDEKKVRMASVGVCTIASPRKLKLVFMMTGTPVIFPNSSMSR